MKSRLSGGRVLHGIVDLLHVRAGAQHIGGNGCLKTCRIPVKVSAAEGIGDRTPGSFNVVFPGVVRLDGGSGCIQAHGIQMVLPGQAVQVLRIHAHQVRHGHGQAVQLSVFILEIEVIALTDKSCHRPVGQSRFGSHCACQQNEDRQQQEKASEFHGS